MAKRLGTDVYRALAGLFFCWCMSGAAWGQARETMTEYKVNAQETALVTTTASECNVPGARPGCKEARARENLKIKIRLDRSQDCNRSGGFRWKLDAVYLGGFNSPTKPAQMGQLPAEVGNDFDVDLATGKVAPINNAQSYTKFDFRNSNQAAYTVWYRVDAVCVSRMGQQIGDPVSSDPRIINRGRGVS